jgi:hypothetical protein
MKKFALIAYLLFLVGFTGFSQSESKKEFPLVFEINKYQDSYDAFLTLSDQMLLSVCDNYVALTYQLWNEMLGELENFALTKKMDLSGAKMFIRVIWNKDGSVKHFAFESRANSKPFDKENFTTIATEFCTNYKLPKSHNSSFFHYGSVNFPVKKR